MRLTSPHRVLLAAVLLLPLVPLLGQDGAADPQVALEIPEELPIHESGVSTVTFTIAIARSWHLYAENEADLIPLEVKVDPEADLEGEVTVHGIAIKAKAEVITFFDLRVPAYEGKVPVELRVENVGLEVGESALVPLRISYQACDDTQCLFPQDREATLKVVVQEGAGAPPPVAGTGEEAPAEPGNSPSPDPTGSPDGAGTGSIFWETVGAFLAGLLVTLTPCVYPLIPVTISFFMQKGGSRARGIPLAIAYGLGIIIMYTALGVIMALIGRDLGSLLGNAFVSWGFVVLFVLLALSMFGYYDLALPSSWQTKLQSGERGGMLGAFFLGLTLGLVAAPCVGPVAGGLMLYVATQGDILFGIITFGAFGFGIALPFMVLGIFSGSLRSMPRAGTWMNTVKHFFGWVLLAFAVYFVNVSSGSEELLLVLTGLFFFFAGLSALLGGLQRVRQADEGTAIGTGMLGGGLLAMLAGIYFVFGPFVIAEDGPILPPQKLLEGEVEWHQGDLDQLLAEARAQGKPVFMDFTARWCIPCQQMELTTFREPEIIQEFKRFFLIRVDVTKPDPVVDRLRHETYKTFTVPFLAFHDSKGNYLPEKAIHGKTSASALLARLKEIR